MSREIAWHNLSWEEAVKKLNSDTKNGLAEEEVKIRREKFGWNLLPEEKPFSKLRIFLEQFKNPLIYILVIAGIVTLILRDFLDVIIIFGVVFLNVIIGFLQENKTSQTLRELKKIIKHKTEVLRNGNFKIIDFEDLVPGDIVILRPGDKVPADGRLIECHNLKINEMALTGEWLSAEKKIKILKAETPLADRDNMVYMGTVVEEGRGKAIITRIGSLTEIGRIGLMLKEMREEKTPFQKKLNRFAKILGGIIIFICFLIFISGLLEGRGFIEIFTTAVAVAVAATPEGLAVALTLVFTFGMREILKRKGLVRKLIAAETLGSTSIIAADKTGTLTKAKMEVAGIYSQTQDHILALKIASLSSEAFIENLDQPMEKWVLRGRPTEKAVLLAAIQAGLNRKELEEREPKIDEIPFNPTDKYSASLHKLGKKESILYAMGAPEVILEKSKLSAKQFKRLQIEYAALTSQGFRVVATAYKKIRRPKRELRKEDLKNMTFIAFISLHDPLRETAKRAIKVCYQAGIRPIIVTGDHKLTAKAVAEKLGFKIEDRNILEGRELDKLSDKEFGKIFKDIKIYARVTPEQKLRIINVWQEAGEVVAMTGDGVNDAPALKKANIGVALGSGAEVAKEASDLTLLTDDFEIIIVAVREGRRIIDNIRKIITYLLTGGFTEVMLIGLAIIFHLPLPVLAGQILWKNLIESTPPAIALTFEQREKGIMARKPESLNLPLLTRQMKFLIFVIGLLTNFLLFGIFVWFLNNPDYGMERIAQIRTIMFAGLAIDSFFFIFSFRNLRQNIWQYNPFSNPYVTFAAFGGFLLLIAGIYLPLFQALLRTSPFGFFEWFILFAYSFTNLVLIEIAKWYYIKKSKIKN